MKFDTFFKIVIYFLLLSPLELFKSKENLTIVIMGIYKKLYATNEVTNHFNEKVSFNEYLDQSVPLISSESVETLKKEFSE